MEVELIQPIAMDQGLGSRSERAVAPSAPGSSPRYRIAKRALRGPLFVRSSISKGRDNCKTYDQGAALATSGAAP